MATKADGEMKFVSVVPLERPGVIEFPAWELARWLYIWQKPWNNRTTIPHLVFLDCPAARQVTWRMLLLEGQAQLPLEEAEAWSPLSLGWQTRRSFATLWCSSHCHAKSADLKRGSIVAREVEPKAIVKPDVTLPAEEEVYAP